VKGGGWTTEYEFLRLAARDHDITLLTGGLQPDERAPSVEELGVRVQGVAWRGQPFPGRVHHLARLLFGRDPTSFWQKAACARALSAAVRTAEQAQTFDLVQVLLGEMAPVVAVPAAPRALFLFDAYSRQLERELETAPASRYRFMWQREQAKMTRWERRWYPHANGVACVSEVDAAALRASLGIQADVIPIAVPEEMYAEATEARDPDRVTLVSMLDYSPNIDAVEWFTSAVWPEVRSAVPTARLEVVGRSPVERVKAAVGAAGADLRPDVPDIRPHYWRAAAAVIPLRHGSGMRNKVLHAMATGAPIVATSVAVEGIPVRHREHLLVADDAPAFAQALTEVLADPIAAAERAARARLVAEAFRPDAIGPALTAWWERTAAARGGDKVRQ
jgi:glycosyltransferase involved in cell wall biosynthesis